MWDFILVFDGGEGGLIRIVGLIGIVDVGNVDLEGYDEGFGYVGFWVGGKVEG